MIAIGLKPGHIPLGRKVTLIHLLFAVLMGYRGVAQHPVGIFENHMDIGNPKHGGSAGYNDLSQTYLISGAGSNIWFNRDEFQFIYKKLKGDFTLTADFAFTGDTAGESATGKSDG